MTDSPPKTRKQKKKDQREKANGLNGKYSAKHARNLTFNLLGQLEHQTNK